MKHIYWLKEGAIAGRTGPNTDNRDLKEIKSNGFSAILLLMMVKAFMSRLSPHWVWLMQTSQCHRMHRLEKMIKSIA